MELSPLFTYFYLLTSSSVFHPVPPKPAHLQSPVTELSSPLGHIQKPPLAAGMEDGGGGRGAVNRERAREKHSKVSDLISRFEENR